MSVLIQHIEGNKLACLRRDEYTAFTTYGQRLHRSSNFMRISTQIMGKKKCSAKIPCNHFHIATLY